jgi:YD repeat-containing protein
MLGLAHRSKITVTTYDYTAAGDLETVNYSDSTPDVTYSYNRLGQRTTAAWSTNSLAYSFNDAGQLLSEAQSGLLGSLSVSNAYDAYLHRTGLSIQNGQSPAPYSVSYGFDTGGRLSNVTQGGYSGSYGYLTNSPLVGTLTFKTNTTTRLTTTRAFDALNRLQSVTSSPAGSGAPVLAVISAYDYNAANLRTRMTLADGSYWIYTYDRLGQVVSGKRYWQDGTPVAGQQFEYGFDDIGNRKTAATGGDASGTGLRVASYGANLLNQYTNRTVPGTVDILGVANPTAAVTANGNTAYRKGDYFWQALRDKVSAKVPLQCTFMCRKKANQTHEANPPGKETDTGLRGRIGRATGETSRVA